MSLFNIFGVAGSGMSAQSVRLNTTASNIANANTVSGTEAGAYRSRQPVFEAAMSRALGQQNESVPVDVAAVVESDRPVVKQFNPNHPLADNEGFVYKSNVNVVDEMANMMSASRSYQANVQTATAAKEMAQQVLRLGKG